MKEIKNNSEHNEGILREIRNRIMKEIWSIIPTSLQMIQSWVPTIISATSKDTSNCYKSRNEARQLL